MENLIKHYEFLIEAELDAIDELKEILELVKDDIKSRKAKVFDYEEEIVNITTNTVIDSGLEYYFGIGENIGRR